jgi:protoporphyrin/coproporphyrin ferrochelatase
MAKQAVLLLAHGTPETVEQVPEYLRNVVSGRPVPPHVVGEIQHRYALIGRSPLTEITIEQARLVEEELNGASAAPHPSDKNKGVARMGHPGSWLIRVYVGMRNWKPYIAEVMKQMRADQVEEAAVICMAPQNSRTSVGLYRRAVEAEAQGLRIDFTEGWAQHPLLADAFAERLRPAWAKLSAEVGFPVPVLFTAHSVPRRTVEAQGTSPHPSDKDKSVARVGHPGQEGVGRPGPEGVGQPGPEGVGQPGQEGVGQPGASSPTLSAEKSGKDGARDSFLEPYWPGRGADPYADEARKTAEMVAARVAEIPSWRFAFQSQGASGGEWMGPSVEETLDGMAREGVKAVILQPIGFLCDHVEILFDVDRLFREYAFQLGIRLERPTSLNGSRTLARAIADLAQEGLVRVGNQGEVFRAKE